MATYKRATRQAPDQAPDAAPDQDHGIGANAQRQAEKLAGSVGESAQQVWLAGIGALGRAQAGGARLFETLIEEGEQLEKQARNAADERVEEVRGSVESRVDGVREFAGGTWDRWEKAFDERMQRGLARLGVPGRDDLAELSNRVDALTAELRRQRAKTAPRKKTAARKTAARKATASAAGTPGGEVPPSPAAGTGAAGNPGTRTDD